MILKYGKIKVIIHFYTFPLILAKYLSKTVLNVNCKIKFGIKIAKYLFTNESKI